MGVSKYLKHYALHVSRVKKKSLRRIMLSALSCLQLSELEWVIARSLDDSFSRNIALLTPRGCSLRVWDIGAHKGEWSRRLAKSFPEASFTLFEASETHRKDLEDSGSPYHIVALSDQVGLRPFYSIGGTGDSFYPELTNVYEDEEARGIATTTLDALAKSEGLDAPDLIKIDTQGSELDILNGAHKILPKVRLVYLECPFRVYNQGAPSLTSYITYMESHGFLPYSLHEIHKQRSDSSIIQIDVLFYNRELCLAF